MLGIVARDTPLAICLTSPPPVRARTLNTSIMPVTVPSSPRSGHRLTIVAIIAVLVSIFSDIREMRASRIFLAFQDLRSDRDAQTSSAACLSLFKPPLKYHSLSKMRVHMAKVRMAMKISTLPPWFKKALMAANASIIASMVYLLLALSIFGDDASGLLIQNMNNTLDRKSTRLNSSHVAISYAVFCLKKKKKQ